MEVVLKGLVPYLSFETLTRFIQLSRRCALAATNVKELWLPAHRINTLSLDFEVARAQLILQYAITHPRLLRCPYSLLGSIKTIAHDCPSLFLDDVTTMNSLTVLLTAISPKVVGLSSHAWDDLFLTFPNIRTLITAAPDASVQLALQPSLAALTFRFDPDQTGSATRLAAHVPPRTTFVFHDAHDLTNTDVAALQNAGVRVVVAGETATTAFPLPRLPPLSLGNKAPGDVVWCTANAAAATQLAIGYAAAPLVRAHQYNLHSLATLRALALHGVVMDAVVLPPALTALTVSHCTISSPATIALPTVTALSCHFLQFAGRFALPPHADVTLQDTPLCVDLSTAKALRLLYVIDQTQPPSLLSETVDHSDVSFESQSELFESPPPPAPSPPPPPSPR